MDKYTDMSRADLAAFCRKKGLSDEGSASVLRKRIRDARDAAKARKAAATATEPAEEPAEATGDELPEPDATEETPEVAPTPEEPTYEVTLTFASDTYFGDEAWDRANCQLVEKQAAEAGHRVMGNARRSRVDGTAVTYVVPVG